jgi:hypothetical protein
MTQLLCSVVFKLTGNYCFYNSVDWLKEEEIKLSYFSFINIYIYIYMYVCMYICMYVCMYICMYVYVYVCMYLKTKTKTYQCFSMYCERAIYKKITILSLVVSLVLDIYDFFIVLLVITLKIYINK